MEICLHPLSTVILDLSRKIAEGNTTVKLFLTTSNFILLEKSGLVGPGPADDISIPTQSVLLNKETYRIVRAVENRRSDLYCRL